MRRGLIRYNDRSIEVFELYILGIAQTAMTLPRLLIIKLEGLLRVSIPSLTLLTLGNDLWQGLF